jgi:TonB family protein
MKAALTKPHPAYSPVARQMKIAGRVEVEALVNEDGAVESAKAVTGNPLLTQSALSAVEKWKFTPFTSDGKPVKAICTLVFDFRP